MTLPGSTNESYSLRGGGRRRRTRHRCVAQAHELVDVELVIGEKHEVLEVLGVGAGVMAQPMQRIVDARCGEEGERTRLAGRRHEGAVDDAVVHRAEIGQIEQVAQQQASIRRQVAFDVVVLGKGEVNGDRLHARADLERDAVVFQEQAELLEVVAREQVGARQRGLVGARAGDESVAQPRIGAGDRVGVDANERVAGAHPAGRRLTCDEGLQRASQVIDAAVVDLGDAGERGGSVVEAGRGDRRGERGPRQLGFANGSFAASGADIDPRAALARPAPPSRRPRR